MKKRFLVYHVYDVDGGFGDAVGQKDCVGMIEATDEEATRYVEKYSRQYTYDHPYSALTAGTIVLEELPQLLDLDKDPIPDCRNWDNDPGCEDDNETDEYIRRLCGDPYPDPYPDDPYLD